MSKRTHVKKIINACTVPAPYVKPLKLLQLKRIHKDKNQSDIMMQNITKEKVKLCRLLAGLTTCVGSKLVFFLYGLEGEIVEVAWFIPTHWINILFVECGGAIS